MLLISEQNFTVLFHVVLRRAREAGEQGIPVRELDASEAYVAGLCGALSLTALRNDYGAVLTFVTLSPEGVRVLKRLEGGASLADVLKPFIRPPRSARALLGSVKGEGGSR
ncbi:MAG: hypothetical protein H0T60_02330 [Acidobacteria bacterium]|nr:hypothetical protein [Acidobacteriota bacterium]